MSLTYSTLVYFQKVAKLLNSKSFQYYAMFCLSFFLVIGVFLGSYSVSAEGSTEDFQIDLLEVHEENEEAMSSYMGVDGMFSTYSESVSGVDTFMVGGMYLYPGISSNHAAMMENPNLSPGAKLGFIGVIDAPITAMLNNPPSIDIPGHLAQEWIPNYDHSAGIYAESGYEMLMATPIVSELWGVTRNIAYMLFVIVFIVAGFMIMFRHKLGGQTMVSVYNTLPNIIVGLILVTFSFAIVGFLISFGGILIRVISGELNLSDPVDAVHPFSVYLAYDEIVTHYYLQAFAKSLVATVIALTVGLPLSLIIAVLLLGAIAFGSIKVFFTLIKAYIGIIFDTIAAPIVFAIATIPGRQPMMKDWFNRVMKNVMVFVLVFFLLNLPIYLMEKQAEFTLFGGDLQGATGMTAGEGIGSIVMAGMALYFLFLAGNVHKMLEDYFPQTGGKGAAGAAENTKKDMSKLPLVGGMFKS